MKTATRLTIARDIISEAKELGINLSKAAQEGIVAKVREERERLWLEANKEAFAADREDIEKNGLWSDGRRLF